MRPWMYVFEETVVDGEEKEDKRFEESAEVEDLSTTQLA